MQPLDPFTIPLKGTYLIEAAAGTGKTYTLALLYLRLVLERQLAVDEILVVTFTRAATDELRSRIRQRLRDALEALGSGAAPDPHIDALLHNLDPGQAEHNLSDALARMDEAAIFTIHGFCRRILEDNAFETGIPFQAEFLESEQLLQSRIIEDFWRKEFYGADKEISRWAAATWTDPEGLLQAVRPVIGVHEATVIPQVEEETLHQQQQSCRGKLGEIQTLWAAHREEIVELLTTDPCLTRNQQSYRLKDRVPESVKAMDSIAEPTTLPCLIPKSLGLLKQSTLAQNIKKKCESPPTHPFFEAFEQFHLELENHIDSLRIRTMQEAINYLRTELTRRKQENSSLSFDDLLLGLSAALNRKGTGQRLAARIAACYPAALVDEFQDTDPLQYAILSRVYSSPAAAVYMIGDPKQAIYSFRGADIFTYIHAANRTPKGNRYTLDTNYRSSAPMVAAINRLFNKPNAFLFEPGISFHPVKAAAARGATPLVIDAAPALPLTALMLSGEGQAGRQKDKPLTIADATGQAAGFCSREIALLLEKSRHGRALLDGNAVEAGDIAVLVRTHDEAESIRSALARQGVNSVYYSRQSVFSTKEAGELFLVLTALIDLSDAPAVRAALATNCFGLDGNQILKLHQDAKEWEHYLNTLYTFQQTWQEKGIMVMLQQLFAEQQVVRRLTGHHGGERQLTNYLHLAELLQSATAAAHGRAGLLRWFARQRHAPDQDAEHQQVRLESDEHLVKIVTIHKSKGLEYPIVFLPFLWRSRKTDPNGTLIFHNQSTSQAIIDLGTGTPEHFSLADRELQAEAIRLLYVAMTRARCSCFFCWGRISGIERSPLARFLHNVAEQPLPGDEQGMTSDLQRLNTAGPIITITPYRAQNPLADAGAVTAHHLTARSFTGRIHRGKPITSYSQLSAGHSTVEAVPLIPDMDSPAETDAAAAQSAFTFPRGAGAGTCLHSILEIIDFAADREEWLPVIRESLMRGGIDHSWEECTCSWLEKVFSVNLPQACALKDISTKSRINELSFLFPLEQSDTSRFNRLLQTWGIKPLEAGPSALEGMMKGFVDLVFQYEGRYYIVDYKSNYLGPDSTYYSQDTLERAMMEHRYDLQYLIYTLALHRYLDSRIQGYSYRQHFGGAYYLFLRGMSPDYPTKNGIFFTRPDEKLVAGLNLCCRGHEVQP